MLIVFTGNGKGKTTAALGQAFRAVGDGKNALMVQFIKGPWKSGEDTSYLRLSPNLKIIKKGLGFVGILGDTLPRQAHIDSAHEALETAKAEAMKGAKNDTDGGKWHIIILDEIWNTLKLELITDQEVSDIITYLTPHCEHLILTGRDCPQHFIDQADLVTEMREVKHPYNTGTIAKKGLEF